MHSASAFEYLKNGDAANYEKVEKYLMERKGKTKNQMKKLMQSANRTDPIFSESRFEIAFRAVYI